MIARRHKALLLIGVLVPLLTGCARVHVDVRVLDDAGDPVEGVGVLVETGPYFADPRGAFGAYDEQAMTDQSGEASVSLGRLGDYQRYTVNLQNAEMGVWRTTITNDPNELVDRDDDLNNWVPNQWKQFQFYFDSIDQAEPKADPVVWIRIRDSKAK